MSGIIIYGLQTVYIIIYSDDELFNKSHIS